MSVRLLLTTLLLLAFSGVVSAEPVGQELLRIHQEIALETNPLLESISTRNGWASIYKRKSSQPDLVINVLTGSANGQVFEFHVMTTEDGVVLRLFTSTPSPPFCIRRQDVLTVLGSKFEKGIWNLETSAAQSALTQEVKQNLDLFSFGPIYQFHNELSTTSMTVYFNLSECAEQISLNRVSIKK